MKFILKILFRILKPLIMRYGMQILKQAFYSLMNRRRF